MLGKLFDSFDDFDTEKIMEAVNFIWENRENILQLIETLPQLLRDTGDTIESAGESAMKASVFLNGNEDIPSASELSELAATALQRCYEEINTAAEIMNTFGDEIDDIRIPSVQPKYIEVLNMKVVGGLEFGESQLLDNAANRLQNGSDRLAEIGKDLNSVAEHLRSLGGALTDAGKDLNDVGVKLTESGGVLRSLADFEKKA